VDYGAALEMRFGATRRGFESRPLRHHVVALLVAAVMVVGCAEATPAGVTGGPLADEAAAVDRALSLTALQPPIKVLGVSQSQAGALVRVPTGLYPSSEEAAREQAKRARPAWGVTLRGMYPIGCGDATGCPLVETWHELAIDRETGALLRQIIGGEGPDDPHG
jgi:hypothetical protein